MPWNSHPWASSINDNRASIHLFSFNGAVILSGDVYGFHNYFNNDTISIILLLLAPPRGICLPSCFLCLATTAEVGVVVKWDVLSAALISAHESVIFIKTVRVQSVWFNTVTWAAENHSATAADRIFDLTWTAQFTICISATWGRRPWRHVHDVTYRFYTLTVSGMAMSRARPPQGQPPSLFLSLSLFKMSPAGGALVTTAVAGAGWRWGRNITIPLFLNFFSAQTQSQQTQTPAAAISHHTHEK